MLKIENSCEIGDLIDEVRLVSGKSWDEVETAMFKVGKYPESTKIYITTQFGPIVKKEGYEWLNDALIIILDEVKVSDLYITNAI